MHRAPRHDGVAMAGGSGSSFLMVVIVLASFVLAVLRLLVLSF